MLLVAGLAGWAAAQEPVSRDSELAAAARREAERRVRVRSGRSYTDADLKRPGAEGQASDASAPAATSYSPAATGRQLGDHGGEQPASESPEAGVEGNAREAEEDLGADSAFTGWRDRLQDARSRASEARAALDANHRERDGARAKLNPMSTSYTNDTSEQLQAQAALSELQAGEGELQRAVDEAEAALRQLEEAAQRSGVPRRLLEAPPSPKR